MPVGARAALAVGILFVAHLSLAVAFIPPWQGPDEPQHVATVRLLITRGDDFVFGTNYPEVEQPIVASMAEHGWWTHYGQVAPDPVPRSFAEGPALVIDSYFGAPGGSRLYYRFVAVVLDSLSVEDVLPQLYAMRLLAAMATLGTFACVWIATRQAFGQVSALAVGTALALHPQFALVSTTASPDAAVNLAGAVFWWQALALLRSPSAWRYLVLMWGVAVAAFMVRRLGATLVAFACAVTAYAIWAALRTGSRRARLAFSSAIASIALAAGVWFTGDSATRLRVLSDSAIVQDFGRAVAWTRFDAADAARSLIEGDTLPRYVMTVTNTFWYSAGWLRYWAPRWWYALATLFGVVAVV